MPFQNKKLSIESIDDISRAINSASLLEIAGHPKPGNIHRTQNFKETRFEHFLVGIATIQPDFREFCKSVYKYSINVGEDYSFVRLGYFFREASKRMMDSQGGGNVLLGHLLILAPIAAAATICLKSKMLKYSNFVFNLKKVIMDTSVEDTINLYEAIRIANPGGMGMVNKYDINDSGVFKQLKSDKITLLDIFELSKERDLISWEYANDFSIILKEGCPYFIQQFEKSKDINVATVNTFLKMLADHPDTLVIRKSGIEAAREISREAREIVNNGGISTEAGLRLTEILDARLQKDNGKLNPGTTADLLAGILLINLLFGLKF